MKQSMSLLWAKLALIALISVLTFNASAVVLTAENYPFPVKDPYIASALSSFASVTVTFDVYSFKYLPNRPDLNVFDRKNEIRFSYFKQNKKAPLLIVVPGVGGSQVSTLAQSMAEVFVKQGFHAITVPNNLSWQYALGVSQSAKPGYFPRDSVEYYQWLRTVIEKAKTNLKMNIDENKIYLAGYSNGGSLVGFIADYDLKQPHPLFNKYIMINPALDVVYGISQLDTLKNQGQMLSPTEKMNIQGLVYTSGLDIPKAKNPLNAFLKLLSDNNITSQKLQWFIGQSYSDDLSNIILVSHFVNNNLVLKSNASKYNLNAITAEAKSYSFTRYLNEIIYPSLDLETQNSDYQLKGSLYSVIEHIGANPHVFIFHNEDDFLLKPHDLELLKTYFDQNLFLFPYGGHLGNMMDPAHIQFYKNILN